MSNKAILVVCALLFVLQGAITYLPFMNMTFGTVPLELTHWKYPFMLGIAVFLIVEVEKGVMRWIDKGCFKKNCSPRENFTQNCKVEIAK